MTLEDCPICGLNPPHGLHFMRSDGSIEPMADTPGYMATSRDEDAVRARADLLRRSADLADDLDYYASKSEPAGYANGLSEAAWKIRKVIAGADPHEDGEEPAHVPEGRVMSDDSNPKGSLRERLARDLTGDGSMDWDWSSERVHRKFLAEADHILALPTISGALASTEPAELPE